MVDKFKDKASKIDLLGEDGQPLTVENSPNLTNIDLSPVKWLIFGLELLVKMAHSTHNKS